MLNYFIFSTDSLLNSLPLQQYIHPQQLYVQKVIFIEPLKGLERQSLYEAVVETINQPARLENKTTQIPLQQIVEQAELESRGPVVVFPEATTTNGKVLLGCAPVIPNAQEQIKLQGRVHLIAFRYEADDFSPVYTAGSFVWHFIQLCGQFSNRLTVRYMIDSDIDAPSSNLEESTEKQWSEKILSLLASTMQKPRAKITAKEKQPFLEYYKVYKQNYKKY